MRGGGQFEPGKGQGAKRIDGLPCRAISFGIGGLSPWLSDREQTILLNEHVAAAVVRGERAARRMDIGARRMSFDGEYRLETPENIEVSYDLAGPGSRFCALLIDTLLMWLFLFIVVIVALIADSSWLRELDADVNGPPENVVTWFRAVVILVLALVSFGYFAFFEIVLRGQTPGKRSLKLRVLRDDGTAAGVLDLLIRNLLRIVDFLPGLYVIGGLVSLFSKMHQRLGDMAAGTIVVKEAVADYRAAADRRASVPVAEAVLHNAALSAEEQRLIRGFLQRRGELLPEARRELAFRLAAGLLERHGGRMDDPESYLERLWQGTHYGA